MDSLEAIDWSAWDTVKLVELLTFGTTNAEPSAPSVRPDVLSWWINLSPEERRHYRSHIEAELSVR